MVYMYEIAVEQNLLTKIKFKMQHIHVLPTLPRNIFSCLTLYIFIPCMLTTFKV